MKFKNKQLGEVDIQEASMRINELYPLLGARVIDLFSDIKWAMGLCFKNLNKTPVEQKVIEAGQLAPNLMSVSS